MSGLHWFQPPQFKTPEAALAGLQPFGVELKPPLRIDVTYRWSVDANGVLVTVGETTVHDDGRIAVWPYRGLTRRQLTVLIATAGDAFENRPSSRTNWNRIRRKAGNYWQCEVVVRADDNDPAAQACCAARDDAMSTVDVRKVVDATSKAVSVTEVQMFGRRTVRG